MGSNMAEAHPVGFQWVMEAKARGAKVIHIDPRFTRTSAVADTYVPIRAGSDIAFLGGVINYILANDLDFREYVAAYTNAATLISRRVPGHRGSRRAVQRLRRRRLGDVRPGSWQYQGATGRRGHRRLDRAQGADASMQPGRAARRSTAPGRRAERPDAAAPASACSRSSSGTSPATPRRWSSASAACRRSSSARSARRWTANSGRERTTALVYSVGWTQHSVGAQYIRAGAIVQLLLGNIGRPGGGVFALRGHASIQGSTDIPTLFNLLPGYLPMPTRATSETSTPTWTPSAAATRRASGATADAYMVSLLKEYWGEHATAENDFGFDYLPRISGDHGTYRTVHGHGGRQGVRLLPARAEPGRRLGTREAAAPGHGEPRLGGRPRPRR